MEVRFSYFALHTFARKRIWQPDPCGDPPDFGPDVFFFFEEHVSNQEDMTQSIFAGDTSPIIVDTHRDGCVATM